MTSSSRVDALFKYRHFDRQTIILCVRWYVSYKLSYRNLVDMMAERGVEHAHTTVLRWVQRFMPEFERRWMRFARSVGRSWSVDETYIRIRGEWRYLYRAVDKHGRTVDFRLSEHRDIEAAKEFFRKALLTSGAPTKVSLDGHYPSHRVLFELRREARIWRRLKVRTCGWRIPKFWPEWPLLSSLAEIGGSTVAAYFRSPSPLDYEFATHRLNSAAR